MQGKKKSISNTETDLKKKGLTELIQYIGRLCGSNRHLYNQG